MQDGRLCAVKRNEMLVLVVVVVLVTMARSLWQLMAAYGSLWGTGQELGQETAGCKLQAASMCAAWSDVLLGHVHQYEYE